MKRIFSGFAITSLCIAASSYANSTEYGWLESARIINGNASVIAKLDTGARTSSLDARNLEQYEKDGKVWARFSLPIRKSKTMVSFEREVMGEVKIKNRYRLFRMTKRAFSKRPLVEMEICLGGMQRKLLVNLTNRKHFHYGLLLGRESIKKFNGVVNPSKTFTTKPRCV